MKMHVSLFCICCTLLVLFFACEEGSTAHKTPRAETALFAYMLADNDLELFALRDVNEMERGRSEVKAKKASKPSLYFAAYIDKKNSVPQHGVALEIQADVHETIPSPIVRAYPENNSADVEVFSSVIAYLMRRYPARNSMLMVWSHGTGWVSEGYTPTSAQKRTNTKSFGRDDSSQRAEMSIAKLAEALRNLPRRLSVLAFDACYMGDVEVAYELQDVADYIVFSQAEIQHDGFPYDTMVPLLSNNETDVEGRLVASAKAYYEYYNNLSADARKTATLSIIKTAQLPALARAVKTYIAKHGIKALEQAEKSAQKLSIDSRLQALRSDMRDLFTRVAQSPEAQGVVRALKNAVLASYNTDKLFDTLALADVHGMSMYVPEAVHGKEAALRKHYKTLRWAKDTGLGDAWK